LFFGLVWSWSSKGNEKGWFGISLAAMMRNPPTTTNQCDLEDEGKLFVVFVLWWPSGYLWWIYVQEYKKRLFENNMEIFWAKNCLAFLILTTA
jgi:hypothetical protein